MGHYRAIAEYYDAEFSQQEMLAHDVPFFLDHLTPKQRVLELAVGTGRAAIPIAQAGHRVVGIDNEPDILAIAQRKRDSVGLSSRELDLRRGDMLRLRLDKQFDWAAVFFNTFMMFTTLKEQDQALRGIVRHLKPRGRLWLDIFQPNLELLAKDVSKDLEPTAFYVPAYDRTVFKTTEVRRDPAAQTQHVTFHYHWFDAAGDQRHETVEFDITFMFPRELRLLIERHGLVLEHLYGNYDGRDLNADSPRMIGCCRRS